MAYKLNIIKNNKIIDNSIHVLSLCRNSYFYIKSKQERIKLLKWFITDDSQGNSQQHLQHLCLSILERHAASGLKELRGCLVLKKTHDENILVPIGSASPNKHRISYIYSTAGKMLKLELHQPVKWLHHR